MILGKNTKIPQTTITNLSHARATRQNIIAGIHSAIYTWLCVDKGLKNQQIPNRVVSFHSGI